MYNNSYDMSFYPYNYYSPKPTRTGLFGGLKKYNWNNFLNNTGKTLNVINQAIPIIYQVRPILNNAITMFRVMNAVRGSDDSSTKSSTNNNNISSNNRTSSINHNGNSSTFENSNMATSNVRDSSDNSSLTFFV